MHLKDIIPWPEYDKYQGNPSLLYKDVIVFCKALDAFEKTWTPVFEFTCSMQQECFKEQVAHCKARIRNVATLGKQRALKAIRKDGANVWLTEFDRFIHIVQEIASLDPKASCS